MTMHRALGVLLLSAALPACPPSGDFTPQIPVREGAARAIALIPSRRPHPDPGAKAVARARPFAKGDELGGPAAAGRPGDIVLENDEVVFVLGQAASSSRVGTGGWNVVDAADARVREDELGSILTCSGVSGRPAVYTEVASGASADGAAWVEARGHAAMQDVEVVTRYTLHPGDRALLVESTLTNKSAHAIEDLDLGDAVDWGVAKSIAPGRPLGFRGPSTGAYVGGVGRRVSYAITSTDGEISAKSDGTASDTSQTRGVTLAATESVRYARVFVVGERPDTASIVAELVLASGGDLGTLEIELREGGQRVDAAAGARVSLFAPGGAEVLTIATATDAPKLEADVPPGNYELAYTAGGGLAMIGPRAPVEIVAREVARAILPVARAR